MEKAQDPVQRPVMPLTARLGLTEPGALQTHPGHYPLLYELQQIHLPPPERVLGIWVLSLMAHGTSDPSHRDPGGLVSTMTLKLSTFKEKCSAGVAQDEEPDCPQGTGGAEMRPGVLTCTTKLTTFPPTSQRHQKTVKQNICKATRYPRTKSVISTLLPMA